MKRRPIGTMATAGRIITLSENLFSSGATTNFDEVAEAMQHFRERYIDDGSVNYHFGELHFRRNDREDLVTEVLLGRSDSAPEHLAAALLIVFRLRNNLFSRAEVGICVARSTRELPCVHEANDEDVRTARTLYRRIGISLASAWCGSEEHPVFKFWLVQPTQMLVHQLCMLCTSVIRAAECGKRMRHRKQDRVDEQKDARRLVTTGWQPNLDDYGADR